MLDGSMSRHEQCGSTGGNQYRAPGIHNKVISGFQGAGSGARTCDRRVTTDLRADSQATVLPTPLLRGAKTPI
ncbi:hypothetical protein PoB_003965100 [Plakobranchus ocellatus]|uniref:Uncharacterized protein n=1 Tax=Plakobranchus ocellatus TaxID=259542 RepID=A0AAV4AY22_9GAST|nr:hypothetical protein PoB_003965100 [Plakobranchus ocellatus]